MLSFSMGKDSVVAWLKMRQYFDRIVPVFMYLIPDLEFIERGLRYYEDYFRTPIIRVPHPSLYRMLNDRLFQTPKNVEVIEELDYPNYTHDEILSWIKDDQSVDQEVYTGVGVRASDSMNRHASIKKYGAMNLKRRQFYPVYDFRKADMIRTMRESGVKLSTEYLMFGRSFDGLDFRFMYPLKKKYPKDYERVREFFPLVDAEIKRFEFRQKHLRSMYA